MSKIRLVASTAIVLAATASISASDWPSWRGPTHDGVSSEKKLVTDWTPGGANQLWHAEFIGRSTPVVVGSRVCVIGRVGEGVSKQEVVACFDARSGEKRWEHRYNVYHTTVAFNRVGWASLAGDPETGNVYAHGCAGQLIAFSPDGDILWEIFTAEEMGRLSGYGGRTQTPIVDGDKLILTFVSSGWGSHAAPRHRYYAFDKRSGDLIWAATPGNFPYDMNTQSAPVVAEIDGRRLIVAGNADGHVYAVEQSTGREIWSFELSRRGLNSTVLVHGDTVYASHSEENLDEPTMGRLVAFRGAGTGDLAGRELWRIDELSAGFASPTFRDGKLYVVDNSANLHRVDARKGTVDWTYGLGTVGKASPVWAAGRLYVPELNGRFHVLELGDEGAREMSLREIHVEDGRYAEIYGSPAIAHGRIYLSTEAGLFCIGDPRAEFAPSAPTPTWAAPAGRGAPATLTVTPAEVRLAPGDRATFSVHAFDALGRPLGPVKGAALTLEGLDGKLDKKGRFKAAKSPSAGEIVASSDGLEARARVRVVPELPLRYDFDDVAAGPPPAWWVGAAGKYAVADVGGERVLAKLHRERGLLRNPMFLGGDFTDYTIAADVRGARVKRRLTDVGLLNSGYTLDLLGNHQRLEIRSWTAERRMAQAVDFAWEMDTWYRMKFEVRQRGDRAVCRGKVWKRGEAEPSAWTIEVEDPYPVRSGSPGLTGYSPEDVHYDNIEVTANR